MKFFFTCVLVLVLGLFIVPFLVFAVNTTSIDAKSYSNYSEQELVDLIAKLQKQLEEVRKNMVQCNMVDVDLSIGDGEDSASKDYVKNLQNFLKEKRHFSLNPTGYFGKITRASLIRFQTASNLTPTGELDSATRAFIKTLSCNRNYQTYKNEVKEEKKDNTNTQTGLVSSINLTGSSQLVNWSTVGYSKGGFKIVWSKNPNPTYPNRDGDKYIFLTDPNANSTTLDAFSGSGTYYVRVCEYTGVCRVYSNEITVSL